MSILELAKTDPDNAADAGFIEAALSKLEEDIKHIEETHNTVLLGDRADFDKARSDWTHLTKAQVAYAVSYWRSAIFRRYSGK